MDPSRKYLKKNDGVHAFYAVTHLYHNPDLAKYYSTPKHQLCLRVAQRDTTSVITPIGISRIAGVLSAPCGALSRSTEYAR